LVSDKGAVKSAKIFAADAAAKSGEPADTIAALNQAFGKVAADLVAWTVSEAAGDDARAEPKKAL
jgi:ABC-type uncharacterized transport system auxiliary subunit